MPRPVNPDTKTKLLQRLERTQRKIRAFNAAEKDKARADDAHYKIIAGALALEHAEKNPGSEFAAVYVRLLKEYVRLTDRWLFEGIFRALLPSHEAEALIAEGKAAQIAAKEAAKAQFVQPPARPVQIVQPVQPAPASKPDLERSGLMPNWMSRKTASH
jgi:hypothetical protein